MNAEEKRRIISAIAETNRVLEREYAYLPENQDRDLIAAYEGHRARLQQILAGHRRAPDNAGRGADLINVPERFERWMNIYPNVGGRLYASKGGAERNRSYQSTGLLKLTYENDRLVAVELVEGGDA